jgi:hypothetical protein
MTLRKCPNCGAPPSDEDADWGIYDSCLPNGIRLSNVDGWFERGLRHLFIERKKNTPNPDNFRWGQEVGLVRLSACPGHAVITEILLDPPDGARVWRIWAGGRDGGWRLLDKTQAHDWLKRWCDFADREGVKPLPEHMLSPGEPTEVQQSWRLGDKGLALEAQRSALAYRSQ